MLYANAHSRLHPGLFQMVLALSSNMILAISKVGAVPQPGALQFFYQPRQVTNMIKMTMGDQNKIYR